MTPHSLKLSTLKPGQSCRDFPFRDILGGVETYLTLARETEVAQEIQKSRFITNLIPVTSETAARDAIERVRSTHPKARHHCTAFILGADARTARHSDDGEPSGTAGAPIYETLQAAELTDTVAIVTRYFGGILLGAGGLTRAYRSSTALAVETARKTGLIRRMQQLQQLTVECAYDHHAQVQQFAHKQQILLGDAQFTATVQQELWVPPGQHDTVMQHIAQLTSGAATVTPGKLRFVPTQQT